MRRLAAAWRYLSFTGAVWRTTDAPLELADATPAWAALDSPAMGLLTFSLNLTLDG